MSTFWIIVIMAIWLTGAWIVEITPRNPNDLSIIVIGKVFWPVVAIAFICMLFTGQAYLNKVSPWLPKQWQEYLLKRFGE